MIIEKGDFVKIKFDYKIFWVEVIGVHPNGKFFKVRIDDDLKNSRFYKYNDIIFIRLSNILEKYSG